MYYIRWSPLVSVPFSQYICLSIDEPSEWSSITIGDPRWQGDDGGVMAGYRGEDIQGFLDYFSNPMSIPL